MEASADTLIKNGLKINYLNFKVEKYVKPITPLQCFRCQKFGHLAANCKEPKVCVACSETHDENYKCYTLTKKCANCGQNHTANYAGCPIYKQKQFELKSKSNESNKANSSRGYSETVKSNQDNLQQKIDKQVLEVETLNKTIKESMEEIKKTIDTKITECEARIEDKINKITNKQNENIVDSLIEFYAVLKPDHIPNAKTTESIHNI